MKCMHSMGAPPASVCSEHATWRGRCPAHGGVHPTTPELMNLLGQLTGHGDQGLVVVVGYKRRRDYNDPDESYLNDRVWGFTVSTKVLGQDHTIGTQGETLEAALWSLCEAVEAKVSDIGRRRAEDVARTQDTMAKFVSQRTPADGRGAGPYR